MSAGDVRAVQLEEFIPVHSVDTMLGVAEALLGILPQQQRSTADDLRRSMVWMKKYIAPTSEYWDWGTFRQPVDQQTDLKVSFIGLGWLVGLVREFGAGQQVRLTHVESELARTLEHITGSVPVEAVARLKATSWSERDLDELAKFLRSNRYRVRLRRRASRLVVDGRITLELGERERVTAFGLSNALDEQVRKVLTDIKRWANEARRFEGADWCAYKRRRLTVAVRSVPVDELAPTADDIEFSGEPSGLYRREQTATYDLAGPPSSHEVPDQQFSIVFPILPYHTGVITPRMVVRAAEGAPQDDLDELLAYYSYLWVNHYTRLWRYLEFEDQLAYASNVRRLKVIDDQALYRYLGRMLEADELRTDVELANRVDDGRLTAYAPPHDKLRLSPGHPGGELLAGRLRKTLIPSTVTQLRSDPLREASTILQHATTELSRSYATFAQTASLRMQRAIQVLQFVFIVAAAAQVMTLLPIAEIAEQFVRDALAEQSWYTSLLEKKRAVSWLRQTNLTLYTLRLMILAILTMGSLALLRTRRLTRLLKKVLE